MASDSWPSPNHSSGGVSDVEYEKLALGYAGSSGVIGAPTDPTIVYGDSSGRQVKIRASRYVMVRGRLYYTGSSDITVSVGANSSGSTRYDLVTAKQDRGTWDVREYLHAGTAGAGVPTPTQNTGSSGAWELPLASVKVVNGATAIAATDVTPLAWYLAPPSITCTSATRPPPIAGLRIFETNTGKEFIGSGSAFISSLEDTGWQAVPPASGWLGGPALVRRYNGIVTLDASFKRTGGTVTAGTAVSMGTVPVGYRPSVQLRFLAYLDGANLVLGTVETNGGIVARFYATNILTNRFVTLNGKSWPVG